MDLNEIQIALFFNEPKQLAYDELSYLFKQKLIQSNIHINFDTTIFPLPAGVPIPQEVPRCQIMTTDQKFKITLSLERCDINCGFDKNFGNQYNIELYYRVVDLIFKLISEKNEIKRYGHIANFIYVVENPKKLIAEKLLKPKLNEPLVDTFVNFGQMEDLGELTLNKIYQFRSAMRQNFSNGRLEDIIYIVKDFNTYENLVLNNSYYDKFINATKDITNVMDIEGYLK